MPTPKKLALKKKSPLTKKERLGMMKLLEKLRLAPGFPINLDLQRSKCTFSGHGFGEPNPKDNRFTITVYGTTSNYAYPLAAIRFNRQQWKEFKRLGDGLLNAGRGQRVRRKKRK